MMCPTFDYEVIAIAEIYMKAIEFREKRKFEKKSPSKVPR